MIFLSLLSILVLVISYIFLIKKNENKNEIVFEEEITDYPIELYLKDEILYLKNNISSVKKKVFF
ncbi:MAG: hypothetical protein P1U46_03390 [Patescibacteria group bacterium]|nr:hypothetical protein [Patescibacteria group bacterium]